MSVMQSSIATEMMTAAKKLKKQYAWPVLKRMLISHVKADCPEIVESIPDFQKALDSLDTIPLKRF